METYRALVSGQCLLSQMTGAAHAPSSCMKISFYWPRPTTRAACILIDCLGGTTVTRDRSLEVEIQFNCPGKAELSAGYPSAFFASSEHPFVMGSRHHMRDLRKCEGARRLNRVDESDGSR